MTINFDDIFSTKEVGTRIRAIMGVPEEILDNSVISSPTFKIKAGRYINKKIADYTDEQLSTSLELLNIAYLCLDVSNLDIIGDLYNLFSYE